MVERFRDYLRQQGDAFTDAEFAENRPWVEERLKLELYTRAFDKRSADHLGWATIRKCGRRSRASPARTLCSSR